ncbi:Chitinase-like protein (modular protein) [Verrucomicrobia bacterium]|nr:Chitinase-like protein (modular protein) [Verrucomicrobiota bacterium]
MLGNVCVHRPRPALILAALACLFPALARADLWVTGYYPGYEQSRLAPSNIDFSTITHVIHFSLGPNSDGSLDAGINSLTPSYSTDLVTHAHAAGRKALICVGGASTESMFQGATAGTNLVAFVNNIINFMSAYGYDGVDLDWEPLTATDIPQYTNFVTRLRTALDGFSPHKLLTVAAQAYPVYGDPPAQYTMFAMLQSQLDQINIMTYDLSGAWEGWVTWYNSPIYDGGFEFPNTTELVPSVDGSVANFRTNGVAPGKLGIGLPFYGDVWTHGAGTSTGGTSLPRQSWSNAPTVSAVTYSTIMSSYYQSNLYHWDAVAQAAYLSITNVVPTNDIFLSYDDQHTCQAKVSYARNNRLGGLMIWELAQDYRATQPAGQRDPLVQSIKQSLATPGVVSINPAGQNMQLGFSSLPLALYRIEWTSNLAAGPWNTLSNNLSNVTGGVLQVTDPAAFPNQPGRFYRVQTPP